MFIKPLFGIVYDDVVEKSESFFGETIEMH